MNLIINGENQVLLADTLSALVEQLGMKSDRVAIELNREIVPRDRWVQTRLADGDRLEIVHFVGGGSGSIRLSWEGADYEENYFVGKSNRSRS
jgi:thiamine biosynthesis protein ThiS